MSKTFITGLLTALAAVLVSYFQANGLPASIVGWEVLAITVVGNIVIYLGKNAVFPSTSLFGSIDVKDLLSGLVLALGSAMTSFAAAAITSTTIDWHLLLTTAGSISGTYLLSKFGFGKKTT